MKRLAARAGVSIRGPDLLARRLLLPQYTCTTGTGSNHEGESRSRARPILGSKPNGVQAQIHS
jgi:hypothetical protein